MSLLFFPQPYLVVPTLALGACDALRSRCTCTSLHLLLPVSWIHSSIYLPECGSTKMVTLELLLPRGAARKVVQIAPPPHSCRAVTGVRYIVPVVFGVFRSAVNAWHVACMRGAAFRLLQRRWQRVAVDP
jgi:hypothetical protein